MRFCVRPGGVGLLRMEGSRMSASVILEEALAAAVHT